MAEMNPSETLRILLERNIISQDDVEEVTLEAELSSEGKDPLELLLEKGKISREVYQEIRFRDLLGKTLSREEQEELILAKVLQDSGIVDGATLETVFRQKQLAQKKGEAKPLTQFLVDMKVLSPEELSRLSQMISQVPVRCEKCGKRFQLKDLEPQQNIQCPDCAVVLLPETQGEEDLDAMVTMAASSSTASFSQDKTGLEDSATLLNAATQMGSVTSESTVDSGDPLIGKRIGKCRILKKLGQGGMGAVYLGENIKLGRKEAVKILPSEFAANPEQLLRFQREARAAGELASPHIVQVYDTGEDQGLHYISMEFVEGQSLEDLIREKGKLDLEEGLNYIKQAAQGLLVAHQKGIIHRDIKPDNMLISKDGVLKLADFGLARQMEDTMGITQTGAIMGTPYYMSPEQCTGNPTDQRSDIYSLGATLYYMLTGKHPFTGETPMAIMMKHLHQEPTPPHQLEPSIPVSLSNVIEKMMEKDPEFRYQTLEEFLEDLHKVEEGEEIGISEGKRRRILRRRLQRIGVAILLLLFGGTLYFALKYRGPSEEEVRRQYEQMYRQAKKLVSTYQDSHRAGDWEKALAKANELRDYNKEYKFLPQRPWKELLFDLALHRAEEKLEAARKALSKGEDEQFFSLAKEAHSQLKDPRKWAKELGREEEVSALEEKLVSLFLDGARTKLLAKRFDGASLFLENLLAISQEAERSPQFQLLRKSVGQLQKARQAEDALNKMCQKYKLPFFPTFWEAQHLSPLPSSQLKEVLAVLERELPHLPSLEETAPFLRESVKKWGFLALRSWTQKHIKALQERLSLREVQLKALHDRRSLIQSQWGELVNEFRRLESKLDAGLQGDLTLLTEKMRLSLQEALRQYRRKVEKGKQLEREWREELQRWLVEVRSQLQSLMEVIRNTLQEKERLLKKYTDMLDFATKFASFEQKFHPSRVRYRPGLYRELNQVQRELLEMANRYGEEYRRKVQDLAQQAYQQVFQVLLKEAKKLSSDEKKRKKAISLLSEALHYKASREAQELLARLRTPPEFVFIPTGKYIIGEDVRRRQVEVASVYMGQFEVSNEQFSRFVEAGGYSQRRYWPKKWWQNPKKPRSPEGWQKFWVKKKGEKGRWDFSKADKLWKSLPVTGISFYEARAYCLWLSDQLEKRDPKRIPLLFPHLARKENKRQLQWWTYLLRTVPKDASGKVKIRFRLPTPLEWEVAARYSATQRSVGRQYPWGNDLLGQPKYRRLFQKWHNVSLRPVWQAEGDVSGFGCVNMGSNVSEWMGSDTENERCGGIRGASYADPSPEFAAKCTFQAYRPRPEDRFEDVGFRLCLETEPFQKPIDEGKEKK